MVCIVKTKYIEVYQTISKVMWSLVSTKYNGMYYFVQFTIVSWNSVLFMMLIAGFIAALHFPSLLSSCDIDSVLCHIAYTYVL